MSAKFMNRPGYEEMGVINFPGLKAAGVIYGWGMALRARLYRWGVLRVVRLPCLVVSVGNLTVGGTGKTPAVIYLAEKYSKAGKRVVILSRGYGRESREKFLVASEGKGDCPPPEACGDEPCLMAQKLPAVPIIIGARRSETGRLALEKFSPDVIILDDAYQHLGIARDENILLIDSTIPLGSVLPAGRLREPISGISRATRIFLTKTDQSDRLDELMNRLGALAPGIPIIKTVHKVTGITQLAEGKTYQANPFKEEPWFAFAAVGSFSGFLKSLESFGLIIAGSKSYQDHHRYSSKDFSHLRKLAGPSARIITTEKDAVKIPESHPIRDSLYTLNIEFQPLDPVSS
ncbi:MAG: tetraacyldisaccharide 4'-kinase [bacterium]